MSAFDISAFYEQARSGETVDPGQALSYIRGFKKVILWGASYLGSAVGKRLIEDEIAISTYWDLRSEQLDRVNNIPVVQPFQGCTPNPDTLVILCISNNLLKNGLAQTLEREGYEYLLGDILFMGLLCPGNLSDGLQAEVCMRSMCCRFVFCERLGNIARRRSLAISDPLDSKPLFINSITLVINSVCSLSCKFCTSYMHSYSNSDRKNIPLERIREDLDRFFDSVDGVGTATIMGGEPFLHSDLSSIVQALLAKPNCGLISISTSGTARIRKHHLEGLKDPRVNVSFSNYLSALQPHHHRIFHENVDFLIQEGVPHTVGTEMPQWIIPSTLYDRSISEEVMIQKKHFCTMPPRCIQIKDGKIHPCDFGNAVYSLHLSKDPRNHVDLSQPMDSKILREQIHSFLEAPFYPVCGRCDYSAGMTSFAGEQGFYDFLKAD